MPCFGPDHYDPPVDQVAAVNRKLHRVEAMLCGILGAIPDGQQCRIFDAVDWKEVGVTRAEFDQWREEHRAKDEARRKAELEDTLPAGTYELRQYVQWKGRRWFVIGVVQRDGHTYVKVLTNEDGPLDSQLIRVRK